MKNLKDLNVDSLNPSELRQVNGGDFFAVLAIGVGLMNLAYAMGKDIGESWARYDKANK